MIITHLTLQNYKQYRGEHTCPIAEDSTVGVLGANGVGKTTLFEAIEWCLYKPSSIRNNDIRPRSTGGEVRVVVRMTTTNGNEVYDVERILKRSSATATVYRLDQMGGSETLVQGTREVTDFITTKLIGLSHSAFVATFFTRQKELGFFHDYGPSERRREVGKLLGFETIKQAQAVIAEDRTRARHDADALQRRYDAMVSGRNLDQEQRDLTGTIDESATAVEQAQGGVTSAEQTLAKTEARNQELQQQRDADARIASDLRDHQSRHTAAIERRDSIANDLERLTRQEEERARLEPLAAQLPELSKQRDALEHERERHQRQQQLQRDIVRATQETGDRVRDLSTLVANVAGNTDAPGWAWSDTDAREPLLAIERLLAVASAIDLTESEQHCGSMRQARGAADQLERNEATLERFHRKCDVLRQQIAELTADGDPAARQQQAQERLEALRGKVSANHAEIDSLVAQQNRSRELIARLEQQHFEDTCPTCGRPFTDSEATDVIATMRDAIAMKDESIRSLRRQADRLSRDATAVHKELEALRAQETSLVEVRTRIANSAEHIERQEAEVTRWRTALQAALGELSREIPPTSDEIVVAERELGRRRNVRETLQPLEMTRRSLLDASKHRQQAEADLATLSDVSWDPDQLRIVAQDHDQASRAASAIEQIDRQLARRPQLTHDLETVNATVETSVQAIAELEKHRAELGFDPGALKESVESLRLARQQDRETREALNAARQAQREAEYRLETLRAEQQNIADLAKEADQRRRDHEELNVMYSEFSEFDRFVAQHISPVLSDTTSDIVAEMTDGRYDRVTFDEDYGIQVYDQSEEGFPLETFSGGERDAISLAARLALSRIVGQQAASPPEFLVLDEVFGSLDADRRERVLSLLGQQSGTHFRQMFIISHVDDVQQSPVFDTIWQVEETADGSSRVITSDEALAESLSDEPG